MITYGPWRTIPTTCLGCGRMEIKARPTYQAGVVVKGWEPMQYHCVCESVDIYNDNGQYEKWREKR